MSGKDVKRQVDWRDKLASHSGSERKDGIVETLRWAHGLPSSGNRCGVAAAALAPCIVLTPEEER